MARKLAELTLGQADFGNMVVLLLLFLELKTHGDLHPKWHPLISR